MAVKRHLVAISLVSFLLLFLHPSKTMSEDSLMEEEMDLPDDKEGEKIKAKNNKEDEDAFREMEPPIVEGTVFELSQISVFGLISLLTATFPLSSSVCPFVLTAKCSSLNRDSG